MKKLDICIIGASHVAAIDLAWREIGDAFPEVSLRSIAGGGNFYQDFVADEVAGLLRVSTPHMRRIIGLEGKNRTLNFDDFDLVIIVGGLSWWTGIDRRLYSQQVVGQALVEHLKGSLAYPLVEEIRKLSKVDIKMTHAPFLGSRTPVISRSRVSYLADIERANQLLFAPMGVELLPQLEDSMLAGMEQSKVDYMVGYRLRTPVQEGLPPPEVLDDLNHVNKAYGALLLVDILADYGFALPSGFSGMPLPDGHLSLEEKLESGQA